MNNEISILIEEQTKLKDFLESLKTRIIQNPLYKEDYSYWAMHTGAIYQSGSIDVSGVISATGFLRDEIHKSFDLNAKGTYPMSYQLIRKGEVPKREPIPPAPIIVKEKSRMQLALEKQQEYMEYGIKESEAIRKLSQDMINFYDGENSHLIENTLTRLHDVSQKFGIARGLIPTLSRWTGLKFEYNISDKDIKSDKDAINLVINELTKNIDKLKVDVGHIDNLTVTLQEYFEDVDKLIVKVKEEMERVKTENYDSAIEEGFRQDKLEQLEQKIADLYETKETTVMLSKQLRMIRKNNLDLYSMLHSRIATRVPTLLASVAVKSIMDRSKRTINHIEGFDKGSDKLLLANNKEISSNLIRTSKRKTEALVERRKTIETIKSEIIHTALELKTLHQINAEKRLSILQDMDAGFEDEIKLLTQVAVNPKITTAEIEVEVETVKVPKKRKPRAPTSSVGPH